MGWWFKSIRGISLHLFTYNKKGVLFEIVLSKSSVLFLSQTPITCSVWDHVMSFYCQNLWLPHREPQYVPITDRFLPLTEDEMNDAALYKWSTTVLWTVNWLEWKKYWKIQWYFICKLKSTDNISYTVKIIDNNYKSLSYSPGDYYYHHCC